MRLIARMPSTKEASFLIDSLRNGGFDRKDLIVSDMATDATAPNPLEAAWNTLFQKTEREGMTDTGTFADGVRGLVGREGILVAVEAPKHEADRIRTMMKDSGAEEIVQD